MGKQQRVPRTTDTPKMSRTRKETGTKLRPYKFLVQPIVQRIDSAGSVLAEHTLAGSDGQAVTLYGVAALKRWAAEFERHLAKLDAEGDGGGDPR